MTAADPSISHQARLIQQKIQRKQSHPRGNYDHAPDQWGFIHSINAGPPPSVNLYLDGTQTTGNLAYLTKSVPWLPPYVPTVGDSVLVRRGMQRSSSDRVVLGKLNGSPAPYPLPLGGLNTAGQFVQGPNALWGGEGAPASTLGATGDWYLRTDTVQTAGSRIYVRESAGWVALSL